MIEADLMLVWSHWYWEFSSGALILVYTSIVRKGLGYDWSIIGSSVPRKMGE